MSGRLLYYLETRPLIEYRGKNSMLCFESVPKRIIRRLESVVEFKMLVNASGAVQHLKILKRDLCNEQSIHLSADASLARALAFPKI